LRGSIELIKDTLFQLGVLIGGLKRGFHNDYLGSGATRTAQGVPGQGERKFNRSPA